MADELTVVVVALIGGEALDQCAQAVGAQSPNCLVVRRDGVIVDARGRRVGIADRSDIPAKRRSAVELASTPLVALVEDTVVPAGGWAEAVTAALSREGVVACGGPVQIAEGLPPQTRALTLSEYGKYNERHPAGEVAALPGCNFACHRDVLIEAMRGPDGLVDLPVFARLKELGRLVWAPAMAVTFAQPYPDGARLKNRFDHGRIYAGAGKGLLRRASSAAKALLLPAVLTARTLKVAGPAKPSTIAWLLLQHTAWAAGEFTGALIGPSRKGLRQWR